MYFLNTHLNHQAECRAGRMTRSWPAFSSTSTMYLRFQFKTFLAMKFTYTNALILLIKIMMCSKLHCRKGFKLNPFSYKMQGGADDSKLADILKYINNTPGSKHKFTLKEASALSTDLALVRPLHATPYTLHPKLCTLHGTPYTLHSSPYALHSILHPTPYALHHTLYTLHSTLYTAHPTPYTLHPAL